MEYEPFDDRALHPGKAARIVCKGAPVGILGEVAPPVLAHFDLEGEPVVLFEIDLESLHAASGSQDRYLTASRFPVSERDVALIVDAAVPSRKLQEIIQRHKLVESSSPFDVYEGEGIPGSKKSIAYRIAFRSSRATLTAEQVDRAQGDILRQLERELGAELRG